MAEHPYGTRMENEPLVFAHRGASGYAPENSFSAFDLALNQKADGLECDIQFSKDGVPVLWHDYDLKRIGISKQPIRDFLWDEITRFDTSAILKNFHLKTQVVSLESFLNRYANKTKLLLEIKYDDSTSFAYQKNKLDHLIKVLKEAGHRHPKIELEISSFDADSIIYCHHHFKDADYTFNDDIELSRRDVKDIIEQMPFIKAICLDIEQLNFEVAKAAKEFNLKLHAYTCNTQEHFQKAAKNLVDVIISDYPDRAKNLAGLALT